MARNAFKLLNIEPLFANCLTAWLLVLAPSGLLDGTSKRDVSRKFLLIHFKPPSLPPRSYLFQTPLGEGLRNGPDKNDSNNGNEHVGMQKRC